MPRETQAPERRTENVALRIRPSLKAALRVAAERDGRTLAAFAERILEEAAKKLAPHRK